MLDFYSTCLFFRKDNDEYVWDVYEESVPMSTYLVAFVVSKFGNEVSPSDLANNNVTFRIWARKDALDQIGKSNLQFKIPLQDGEFRMNTVVEFQSEVGVI